MKTYERLNKRVVLLFGALFTVVSLTFAQQAVVKGHVVDAATNEPVVGAHVKVGSSKKVTITDADGYFSIKVKGYPAEVAVSSVGYEAQNLKVEDGKPLALRLFQSQTGLDEVVVQGKQSKSSVAGSISDLSGEIVQKAAIVNVLEALQGRVGGLTVDFANGLPGAEASLRLRGDNTSMEGTGFCCSATEALNQASPLVLLDGVPVSSESYSSLGLGALGNLNALNALNPSDVEKIQILKDADATAIYGAKGVNGVILITRKKDLNL